jgi:hypothetical protein
MKAAMKASKIPTNGVSGLYGIAYYSGGETYKRILHCSFLTGFPYRFLTSFLTGLLTGYLPGLYPLTLLMPPEVLTNFLTELLTGYLPVSLPSPYPVLTSLP